MHSKHVVGDSDCGSRKRQRNTTSKEQKKEIRYGNHDPNLEMFKVPCKHKDTNQFKCNLLKVDDIQFCREKFIKHPNKVKQDVPLSHCITMKIPRRKRSRKTENQEHHQFFLEYSLRTKHYRLEVGQKMFLAIFSVKKRRGDTKFRNYVDKKRKVRKFIATLKGKESHCSRAISRRIYLSSEMNITTLHKLYNDSVTKQYKVNYKFFSRLFNNDFNIKFGNLATDVCGFCKRHQNQISISKDKTEQQKLVTNLRIHKLRAKQFYKLLSENTENAITFCFDLQQVQDLLRVSISEALYAQQLSFNAFCVTDVTTRHPVFYTWTENQASRGCVEIGFALLDFVRHWLLAVFLPDMNNREDTNSQTEDDDEDVHEHVCECNEDIGGIKI
ncbi:hypothetical protein ILUMI_18259 [Ignelater luminosus]|uniref:Uncharacterized protein n=1 Tax=Ignelater luminosus TaxID=2038154 RepID=A0A8K0CK83_IGNLU|nr:hypothetical protein ILUMI_18259 [Ignelater luminosus]